MLTALSFFGVGTLLCAIAPSMEFLIAARAIAGVGGGGLASVGSIIFSDLVSLQHRGLFQGYANICYGLGAGLGGPVGGWISDTFGWYVRTEERADIQARGVLFPSEHLTDSRVALT
jgi:MFS family permease